MENIFDSKPLNDDQKERVAELREDFHLFLNRIDEMLPNSREKSIVITKLEEACMWAIKGISREEEKEG